MEYGEWSMEYSEDCSNGDDERNKDKEWGIWKKENGKKRIEQKSNFFRFESRPATNSRAANATCTELSLSMYSVLCMTKKVHHITPPHHPPGLTEQDHPSPPPRAELGRTALRQGCSFLPMPPLSRLLTQVRSLISLSTLKPPPPPPGSTDG